MLLNMDPPKYMLWVLKSVKAAELEQALLVLPMMSVERLVQYLLVLLKRNMAVKLCSKVAVFVVKTHKKALLASQGLSRPLRELKGVMRVRLEAERDVGGLRGHHEGGGREEREQEHRGRLELFRDLGRAGVGQ